jgi:hypothetical protein
MSLLHDPAFLVAVGAWMLVLAFALWCLCRAAAQGDQMAERARRDVEQRRIVAGGGFRVESRRRDHARGWDGSE